MLFSELNISKPLLNALSDLGFVKPTTIQEKAYSTIMSGRDVVGIAQTGTGKTIAYLLPCIRRWTFNKEKNPTIVVIVPTRELVLQVVEHAQQIAKYTNIKTVGIFGGINMARQTPMVSSGVDLLVATPGRLLDFTLNGTLKLKSIKHLIIDEVDEMLELGFRSQLMRIIDLLPSRRQNLMFSATMTEGIKQFIDDFFDNPSYIEAARTGTTLENIKQTGFKIPNFNTKINFIEFLLTKQEAFSKVLLFVSSKSLADDVFERLSQGFASSVGVIHSNKSQNNRLETYRQFNDNKIRLLIATDLVGRGLDFEEITHVVNFDFPEKPEDYIHRIGRTGRADKKGVALTFITRNDLDRLKQVEILMGTKISLMKLPQEVEITTELQMDELPKIDMKVPTTTPLQPNNLTGSAFHEKKEKNKKVNMKIRRKEAMRIKYGKPQTRGQKQK